MRGTASLVLGIISETIFMNTVRDSKMVTPEKGRHRNSPPYGPA